LIGLIIAVTLSTAPAAVSAQDQGATKSLQSGGDQEAQFLSDPSVHDFYDLSVAKLGKGAPPLDMADYQAKAMVLFGKLAAHMGATPEQIQEHLKLIPAQMVQIVKDDPKVLDSFENFITALVGPR
jgi:hypothetical protein